MAQPQAYNFYLRGFIGGSWRYYYIDSNGDFADTLTQTDLQRAPSGWQELELEWERGFTYFGMFTAFTAPLKFVKDGAKILRHLHYTSGIEAICELWVEKFNTSTYAYETFFKADLDFSTLVDEFDSVSISIMENGFPAKLKAREDTQYEIEIADNAAVQYIKHDGIDLKARLTFAAEGLGNIETSVAFVSTSYAIIPYITYILTEGTNIFTLFYDVILPSATDIYFIQNNSASTINYVVDTKGVFIVNAAAGFTPSYFNVGVMVVNSSGSVVGSFYNIYSDTALTPANTATSYNVPFNEVSIPLASGNRMVYICYFTTASGGGSLVNQAGFGSWELDQSDFETNVYLDNRYETTYVPCLKAMDVYATLIDRISDSEIDPSDVHSTILETTYLDEFYIMSGDALRNFPKSVLKISFADFFKWVNIHFGAAFYYTKSDNSVHLEHKEVVYDYTGNMPFSIGSVNKVKITPFTSEAFNTLKIGCGDFSYDSKFLSNEVSNGKDECNTNTYYSSPLVRVKRDADYVTNIRTDRYGIELVRINLDGKTLSDASTDNEIYAIHAEADDSNTYTILTTGVTINYHNIYRDAISVGVYELDNIYSPETAYNIIFSTKRNIFRNGNWFRALLKMNDNDELVFQTSAKTNASNTKMITKVSGVSVFDEGANELIGGLCDDGDELFLPFVVEFETKEEVNLYNLIESYPYDYIEFTFEDEIYMGFIISAASKPQIRGTTRFKLLLGRDTTLSQLIR